MIYQLILWRNGAIEIQNRPVIITEPMVLAYSDALCIDTMYQTHEDRYGQFIIDRDYSWDWEHVPLEEFPPEFKAHLLLLGVI